jgi:hypothetical protein
MKDIRASFRILNLEKDIEIQVATLVEDNYLEVLKTAIEESTDRYIKDLPKLVDDIVYSALRTSLREYVDKKMETIDLGKILK